MTRWRERTVDLDGPVRVVDYGGDGPWTFVCVHGLGGWALDWQLLAPHLTPRGRVVAVDLPGFGHSPVADRSGAITAQRDLLRRYLAHHVTGPVVLVGNSMGGAIGMLLAAQHPAVVDRLVLVSPALPVSLRGRPHPLVSAQFLLYALPRVGEAYMRYRHRRVDPRTLVDLSLNFIVADAKRLPRDVIEERYGLVEQLAASVDGDLAFLAAARSLLRLLLNGRRYERVIRQVRVPTLVLHGTEDRLVPAYAAWRLTGVRNDWALHIMQGIGHVPQLEAPRAVADIVLEWVGAAVAVEA